VGGAAWAARRGAARRCVHRQCWPRRAALCPMPCPLPHCPALGGALPRRASCWLCAHARGDGQVVWHVGGERNYFERPLQDARVAVTGRARGPPAKGGQAPGPSVCASVRARRMRAPHPPVRPSPGGLDVRPTLAQVKSASTAAALATSRAPARTGPRARSASTAAALATSRAPARTGPRARSASTAAALATSRATAPTARSSEAPTEDHPAEACRLVHAAWHPVLTSRTAPCARAGGG